MYLRKHNTIGIHVYCLWKPYDNLSMFILFMKAICDLLQEKGLLYGYNIALSMLSTMVQISKENIDHKWSYDHFCTIG